MCNLKEYFDRKTFPGHGDTATDSHSTLPVVKASRDHLEMVEFYPYKRMFDEGLVSVMVAHLNVPSLEQEKAILLLFLMMLLLIYLKMS